MSFQYEWANLRTNVRIVIDWLEEEEPNIERCIDYLKKSLED